MSEVRVVVRDRERDLSGTLHGSDAYRLIAALSAEPETIEELEAAVCRFIDLRGSRLLGGFHRGIDDQPWDAGVVVIDLAARLIATENSYFSAHTDGAIDYHDGHCATDLRVNFRLPDDWRIDHHMLSWEPGVRDRRAERLAQPPLDFRAVLYGEPLLRFIATECLAALRDQKLIPLPAPDDDEYPGSAFDDCRGGDERDLVRQVHVRWMMTPREDLRGQTPRDLLVARRDFINGDLHDREYQWTMQGRCPPGLAPDSFAFRYGGCGTHEFVIYYYLVRGLLWSCRDRLAELKAAGKLAYLLAGDLLMDELPRLVAERDRWLDSPDPEYHGRTPRSIIDRERQRLPEGMSGHEAMIDHDCPLCQMMADDHFGPMFWHLDGCNMDDDFAFSHHDTLAEYEAEQREYEEFSRKMDAERAERERLGVEYPSGKETDNEYPWKRSFVAEETDGGPFVTLRLFAIGSRLAELTCDLKQPSDGISENRPLIDQLHRDFGNLREVCRSADEATVSALIQPVLDRFCDSLSEVAAARADLGEECADLQSQLQHFLDPPKKRTLGGDYLSGNYDDIPF
jgi:hypothetical protein